MSEANVSLTAAECASRTGLTVRALRVYERYGLIAPPRTPNGWRYYGTLELMRLNTITVLKAAGLTLVQIRDVIASKNPSLQQVLQAQVEAWKARKVDAERGQALAELSLQRLRACQAIGIDELCNLVRSLEMSGVNPSIQQAFDRHMTPEEQQAWIDNPRAGLWSAYVQAQREQIFPELRKLMEQGADPTSPRVQELVDRNSQLMTQYEVRELSLQESTSGVVRKAMRARVDLVLQALSRPDDPNLADFASDRELSEFMIRAQLLSPRRQASKLLLKEAKDCSAASVDPASPQAQALVERFSEMCRKHFLGEPTIFAQWARKAEKLMTPENDAGWEFLIRALGAARN